MFQFQVTCTYVYICCVFVLSVCITVCLLEPSYVLFLVVGCRELEGYSCSLLSKRSVFSTSDLRFWLGSKAGDCLLCVCGFSVRKVLSLFSFFNFISPRNV